jgi:glyoxylase-like metal-dependent hydrolase (beta-lactamase superfamily II)
LLLRIAVGGEHHPEMSRPVKAGVKDSAAFLRSLESILSWDFDRVIFGHGDVIDSSGKAKLRAALDTAGVSPDDS